MQRSPAVAGTFYPADPGSLNEQLDQCLGPAGPATDGLLALLVPHAGYVYSGRTAGRTYAVSGRPEKVLLLGPNHTGSGRPASIWNRGGWKTPLGVVPVDEELADRVLQAAPLLEPDQAAHLG